MIVWLIIMIPVSAFITGIGVYAWRRKKPMWFWSGTKVRESEISDVPAYNRANAIMWICYSAVFWLSAFLGLWNETAGGILLIAGCLISAPVLPMVYGKIYNKYRRRNAS